MKKTEIIEYRANGVIFKAEKLLPCPFCGTEPNIKFKGNPHTKTREVEIKCPKCRIKVINKVLRYSHEWITPKAIAGWNKRLTPDSTDASTVEEIRGIMNYIQALIKNEIANQGNLKVIWNRLSELVTQIEYSLKPTVTNEEIKKKNKPTDAYGGLGSELESGNMNYDAYYS